jgi:hypothetical protein
MKISKIASGIAICLCLTMIGQFAQAQDKNPQHHTPVPTSVRVGGWALTANGKLAKNFEYTGSCPVNLKFDWGLIATESTEVKYRFKRSDASLPSAYKKVNLPHPNTSVDVSDSWDLGAKTTEFKDFKGWIKLTTFEPNKVEQKIDFTLHCR